MSMIFVHISCDEINSKSWLPVIDKPEWCLILYQITLLTVPSSNGHASRISHTEFKNNLHILEGVCRVYQEFSTYCWVQINTRQQNHGCCKGMHWLIHILHGFWGHLNVQIVAAITYQHIMTTTDLGYTHTILSYWRLSSQWTTSKLSKQKPE